MSNNVNDGLTYEGKAPPDPNDVNSEAGFNAAVARAANREADPAQAVPEDSGVTTPDADSGEAIIASLQSPDTETTDVMSNVVISDPKPPAPASVEKPDPLAQAQAVELEAARDELAARRALDVIGNPAELDVDNLTPDQIVALYDLKAQSPGAYAEVKNVMDETATDEATALYGEDADLDLIYPNGLPGEQVDDLVLYTDAYIRRDNAEDMARQLLARRESETRQVVGEHLAAQGLDGKQAAAAWHVDREVVLQFTGSYPEDLPPAELRELLLDLRATSQVMAHREREVAIQRSIIESEMPKWTRVNDAGEEVSTDPTPKFREMTASELEERVQLVKAQQARKGRPKATAQEIADAMLEPASTDIRNPKSWDIDPFAAMEQDAREEQKREMARKTSRLGMTRRGR